MHEQTLKQLKNELELREKEGSMCLFGQYEGYPICIIPWSKEGYFTLFFSIAGHNALLKKEDFQELCAEEKWIDSLSAELYQLTVHTKHHRFRDKKCAETLQKALQLITAFLQKSGYQPCCSSCGSRTNVDFLVTGHYESALLCPDCMEKAERRIKKD